MLPEKYCVCKTSDPNWETPTFLFAGFPFFFYWKSKSIFSRVSTIQRSDFFFYWKSKSIFSRVSTIQRSDLCSSDLLLFLLLLLIDIIIIFIENMEGPQPG